MNKGQAAAEQRRIESESIAQRAARLPGLGARGSQLFAAGKIEDARAFYEQMLSAEPESREAHAGLYCAYSALGDKHHAASHLGMAMQWPAILTLPYRGVGEPVPVLLLLSMNSGNALLQRFLNDRVFQIYVALVEFFRKEAALPHHRLIINAVGDADVRSEALAAAERLIAGSSAPVINCPAKVLATGRCENAHRLGRISGLLAPHCAGFSRERLMASTAAEELREQGFEFPILARTPGCHMGRNFVRVEKPGELGKAIAELPGSEMMVLQYLDGRGADGNIRKYRVLMIGGKLYPVHLAIAKHWKIHYFSAEMENEREHRAEESRFLSDMPGVLGPSVMTALDRVQETLGLDYGGIDFGLNAQGQVLLYEANATMAVYRPDGEAKWDYRRLAVERIYAAVQELSLTRAGAECAPCAAPG